MPRETKRPQEPDAKDLPELTPKQLGFVQGILKGMTASDAYRASYDAQNMADDDIWREASLLRAHPKVSQWLRHATGHNIIACKVTLENHTAELDRLSALAEKAGAYGASIKAQELRGRANGLYVDQIKTDTGQADVLQALALIGKTHPELARSMSEGLGLSDSDTESDNQGSTETTH